MEVKITSRLSPEEQRGQRGHPNRESNKYMSNEQLDIPEELLGGAEL
jgi:hypothetical protein